MTTPDFANTAQPKTPTTAHRQIMLFETGVSTAVNALGPAAVIWALGIKAPESPTDQAATLARATVLSTFATAFIVTALVRGRLAKGVPPLARFPGWGWIPRSLVFRALFWVACALPTIVPVGLLAALVLGLASLHRTGLFFFNVLFGAIVGAGLTPFIVWLALADARAPRS